MYEHNKKNPNQMPEKFGKFFILTKIISKAYFNLKYLKYFYIYTVDI